MQPLYIGLVKYDVPKSIIFFSYLKVSLRMVANGALLGSVCAENEVSAVAAFPHNDSALFEYSLGLYVGKKRTVSFLVSLLNSCNASELSCELVEALCLCVLCELIVHIGPFVVFTLCCVEKVFSSVAKLSESLEPKLCVLLLVISGLEEYSRDLLVSCFLCYGSKVGIFISCLRLACKSGPKILLGLGSGIGVLSLYFFKFVCANLANGTLEIRVDSSLMNVAAYLTFPFVHNYFLLCVWFFYLHCYYTAKILLFP